MNKIHFFVLILFFAVTSCTLDKTDYGAEIDAVVTEHFEFKEVISFTESGYTISVEALNGTLYKGYNEIRVKINSIQTQELLSNSNVTLLPVRSDVNGNFNSCPNLYNLEFNSTDAYYSGYTVFTSESTTAESWKIYMTFTDNNQTYSVNQSIAVQEQVNKNLNMTTFTGNDGVAYVIALIAPQKPKIAQNELVAGIYKYNPATTIEGSFPDVSQFSFSKVANYTLLLDPRMPEPSMGNHSSLNNVDLTPQSDGLYYGVVNYTMTGNWTLNFILQNQNGEVVKGTAVSTAFTPGIEGAKSELYINILF